MTNLTSEDRPPKSFIQFGEEGTSKSGVTQVWGVFSIFRKDSYSRQNVRLGKIAWHGAWRKYCFFPSRDTLYEWLCLRDIARFCEEKTAEHRGKL